ncbi:MAG: hypothetical protein NC078_05690 [Ruminococcus sp.]|nr:hypothetical protein [Ruminococcus sp.]
MTTSYKVAVGGVISALCLTLMFMTGMFPLLSMAIPIYAGAMMIIVAKEVSPGWAYAAYCAVSLLSLFLTPDKEASTLFIFFFGYYPILLPRLNGIKHKLPRVALKLAIFNFAVITWYKLITFILGIYDYFGDFAFLGKFAVPAVLVFVNLIFAMYDYTIKLIEEVYVNWFRPTYFGKKKGKRKAGTARNAGNDNGKN